jgi:MFS family permease
LGKSQRQTVGYLDLLRHNKAFRFLWSGQIISLLGDWFNLIASASLIATLTQSGAAVGGLFVVKMLAPFIMSPFAGVIADRYNRKHIVMTTDILRGIIVMGFIFIREPEQVWMIYVLTAVQSALQGIFFPAWNSILPDITKKEELGAANALASATWSVMLAFGAALGGIVSGIVGVYPAFVIDGITFFASVLIISQMPYQPLIEKSTDTSIMAGLRQYADGLRYLRQHTDTLIIALHKGMIGLTIVGVFQVVQVTVAEKYFTIGEGGSISLGIIYVAIGIGTGVGPIVGRWWAKDRDLQLRMVIAMSYVCSLVGFLIAATLTSFEAVLLGAFLRGVGGGTIWVLGTQLLLQIVPNEVRGRVFSTEFAFNTIMTATSSGTVGILIDSSLGVSGVLNVAAVAMSIPFGLWVLWIMYGKRDDTTLDAQSATT